MRHSIIILIGIALFLMSPTSVFCFSEEFIPSSSPYIVEQPLDIGIYSIEYMPTCSYPIYINKTDTITISSQCIFTKININFIVPPSMEVSQLINNQQIKPRQYLYATTPDHTYSVIRVTPDSFGTFVYVEKTSESQSIQLKDIDSFLYDNMIVIIGQLINIQKIDQSIYDKLMIVIENIKLWMKI